MSKLTHLDEDGKAKMVDVGDKTPTKRTAIATGRISMQPETLNLVISGTNKKGDVLAVARIAGIMAAKKKPVEIFSVTDLGLDNALVGTGAAWSVVADFADRPPKAAGVVVTDDGAGGTAIADYLTSAKFI